MLARLFGVGALALVGSAMASCDDGIVETWRDAAELVDEISAAPVVRVPKGKS